MYHPMTRFCIRIINCHIQKLSGIFGILVRKIKYYKYLLFKCFRNCNFGQINGPRKLNVFVCLNIPYNFPTQGQISQIYSISLIFIVYLLLLSNGDVTKQFVHCQVMDSENGWTTFRPYVPLTWNYLRANFRTPFLLSSATMEEDSLERISG